MTSASGSSSQDDRSVERACPTEARRWRRWGSCSARDARRKNRWWWSPSWAPQLSQTQWSASLSIGPYPFTPLEAMLLTKARWKARNITSTGSVMSEV